MRLKTIYLLMLLGLIFGCGDDECKRESYPFAWSDLLPINEDWESEKVLMRSGNGFTDSVRLARRATSANIYREDECIYVENKGAWLSVEGSEFEFRFSCNFAPSDRGDVLEFYQKTPPFNEAEYEFLIDQNITESNTYDASHYKEKDYDFKEGIEHSILDSLVLGQKTYYGVHRFQNSAYNRSDLPMTSVYDIWVDKKVGVIQFRMTSGELWAVIR